MITLATHPNGVRVIKVNQKLVVNLPIHLLKKTYEIFENGTRIYISRCDFFDGYLGIDFSSLSANNRLEETLAHVLGKKLKESTLIDYLDSKGFDTVIWLSLADNAKLKLQTLIVY